MKRRRFLFWLSFGMFTLAEKLRFGGLDRLAAATIDLADPKSAAPESGAKTPALIAASVDAPEHWTAQENDTWRWFERENYIDGKWKLTGITTPINKETGEAYTGKTGYLAVSEVPEELRQNSQPDLADDKNDTSMRDTHHDPDAARISRHGRPPSKWLRSLNASELHIWLKTIDPSPAGVEGMTYWTHLTRDHFFDPVKITGLAIDDQAKLHAAAHAGY
jgi:hypothetical protein